VVVEVKRRKLVGKPGAVEAPKEVAPPPPAPTPAPVAVKEAKPAPAPKQDDVLTRQEKQAKFLREAEEARLSQMEEARKRDTKAKKDQSAEEKRRAEEKRKTEVETAKKAQEEIAAAEQAAVDASANAAEGDPEVSATKAEKHPPARKFTPVAAPKRPEPKQKQKTGRSDRNDRRQSGKLTVNRALRGDDGAARARSLAALKRAREKEKRAQMSGQPREPREKQIRDVIVPEAITVQELSKRMGEKGAPRQIPVQHGLDGHGQPDDRSGYSGALG